VLLKFFSVPRCRLRLEKTPLSKPVQRLADEIGRSRQHFSDRFRDAIGVTPKSAARVFRFERARRLIACKWNNDERAKE
jgi:transcriptional regulator GlxA family with amidase domain